jgi:AcrR family transcriptional regulator
MMGMNVPYEATGRINQKTRTRDALIAATRELLAEGAAPTMEGAAARAGISRTTAYRYFPNRRALLTATYPHIDEESLLGPAPPEHPEKRLDLVAEDQTRRILNYEPEMRTALRLSLEPESAVRSRLPMNRGLRIGWIEDALAPLRDQLPAEAFSRLVHGIGSTLGIEAFVWLVDIAGVPREEAVRIMRSNASALLGSALAASAD